MALARLSCGGCGAVLSGREAVCPRCGEAVAMTTLVSPGPSAPVRWCRAIRADGQCPATSAAIAANAFSASGSNASYSSRSTVLPWFVTRTVPTNVTTAP